MSVKNTPPPLAAARPPSISTERACPCPSVPWSLACPIVSTSRSSLDGRELLHRATRRCSLVFCLLYLHTQQNMEYQICTCFSCLYMNIAHMHSSFWTLSRSPCSCMTWWKSRRRGNIPVVISSSLYVYIWDPVPQRAMQSHPFHQSWIPLQSFEERIRHPSGRVHLVFHSLFCIFCIS